MHFAPAFVRDRTEKTGNETDNVIAFPEPGKRLMPTIVLYDENTNQEKSGHCCQWDRNEYRPVEAKIH
jgi:hypothetical protein